MVQHLALALPWKLLLQLMIDLKNRSYQKELMDGENIPFADMAQTLEELNVINTMLGGHSITLKGVAHFLKNQHKITICEIGCGGGDNLFAIDRIFKNKQVDANFIGIDIKNSCIEYARTKYPALPCEWICSDYKKVNFDTQPTIIFNSLFCHHFTDEQLVYMLQWMHQNSTKGFFINDLHRNAIAYYLIKWITAAFSKSYLVKNDACLSVARSFSKKDWENIFSKAGIHGFTIQWQWAFRWLVFCEKNDLI